MTDASRPRLHFTARDGWINDPLGLTWHDGRYHLFFQYVPGRTTWALDCRWGHAAGDGLTAWQELEPALEPGDGDDGVWSGCLVRDEDGGATVLYTAVSADDPDRGRIRLAHPDDDSWRTWTKGPVVLEAPEAPRTRIFRDPFVLREDGGWRMLVGAALPGEAALLTYTSPDLERWTADGVAASRASSIIEPIPTGDGWECPQLLTVDGVDVLVVSVWHADALHHVAAAVGDWSDGRFAVRRWQALSDGPGSYAPTVFRDREGRPCIVFWLRDVRGDEWAGALSAPQLLTVEDDLVVMRPHPDVLAASTVVEVGSVAEVAADGPTFVRSAAGVVTDLRIAEADLPDVHVRAAGDDLVMTVGAREAARIPREGGRLEVLVDGPVVELWHGPSVFTAVR